MKIKESSVSNIINSLSRDKELGDDPLSNKDTPEGCWLINPSSII